VAGPAVMLALVAGWALRPSHATSAVHLEIRHSRFDPASLSVRQGTTVRIVVHNADPIDHELIVGDAAVQDSHEHGLDTHHDGSVPGQVSVPAGAVVTTTYRFGGPGRLLYGCHLPGHWAYGMHGQIDVTS
jgi:uncharacterized cupredoxin-like copper-binding protein